MIDNEFRIPRKVRAAVVSTVCPKLKDHTEDVETSRSLNELKELLRTLGIETAETYIQHRKTVDAASIIGKGKLEEISSEKDLKDFDLLVFDIELTASQIRNIQEITNISVVDRVHVILEIFAEHARTKEAKIQIEIARLKYLLPRLSGFWSHLGRQRGGIGVKGGEGEQQIELDRRIIRKRIEFYKKELEEVVKARTERKKRRENRAITAALVGYTNAGKSSLMNKLCKVDVLVADQLFATLDSTYRTITPDTKPPMILIDTVGFISNRPNTLIDGFKTTLESALEADLLIIVCDISDPDYKKQLAVTEQVLGELGINDKEKLLVFNKKDLLKDSLTSTMMKKNYPTSFCVSSLDDSDMKNLREYIIEYFLKKQAYYDVFIPYNLGDVHSKLLSQTNILNTVNHEKGIYYRLRVPDFIYKRLDIEDYILAPNEVDEFRRS